MADHFHRSAAGWLPGADDDPTLAPLRVLVAEPDVATADLLTRILRGRGYEVEIANDEATVLDTLDSTWIDVVLLAWALPGATGLQVLRKVRGRFAMPDLPVMLMSSQAEPAQVVCAFDRGANDFLEKPLNPDVTLVRVHNLVALSRARLALRQQAMVDALTGVFNRRFVMQQLQSQVAQAQRYNRPLSFCLCDIDHFKSVNDNFGHRAGDEALKLFASVMRDRVRRADVVGRFGGDELCILFPETSAVDALVAVESIRNTLATTPVRVLGVDTCLITGSFGIAELRGDPREASVLVSHADDALYAAKTAGRNRASVYDAETAPRSSVSVRAVALGA